MEIMHEHANRITVIAGNDNIVALAPVQINYYKQFAKRTCERFGR